MTKILIIGQGPSSKHSSERALDGRGSGDRLAKLFGITRDRLFEIATTLNLLEDFYGKNGKGDKFPIALAKKHAEAIKYRWAAHNKVLLLGSGVAAAFGFEGEQPLKWISTPGVLFNHFAIVPHPSGVNRWYNDPENRERAENFLRKILKDFALRDAGNGIG